MIRVQGTITIRNNFDIELDMTEEEFDDLEEWEQDDLISGEIDWHRWTAGADTESVDVDDVAEIEEDEK